MRERAAAFGLAATTAGLTLSGNILLGRPGRDADVERVRTGIRAAGAAGLRVLTYSFTALRASEGYYALDGVPGTRTHPSPGRVPGGPGSPGRGGARLRGFDFGRVRHLPPLPDVGTHSHEAMWERLEHFLRAVIPTAEDAGVRLALHPNDPPVPEFRGVAQPVRTLEDLQRVVAVVDSPANCLYLDTGVLTEMGEGAAAAIRYFGERGRIGSVHFRNVMVDVPYLRYTEGFLDEGDGDPAAWMDAFYASGYDGALDPDHTPGIDGDTLDTHVGWAFAVGQLIALRNATERRHVR